MGGSPQTGRAFVPQDKTTERGGGFVGQPLKEKTKQTREEDVHLLHVGIPKHLVRKVGQPATFVRKPREGKFWKLFTNSFVYQGPPLRLRARHTGINQTWLLPARNCYSSS